MNDSIRFGIVQGRLTQSPPGALQWFPGAKWTDEFALARELGLDYIELIAETQHNPENPLWSDDGIDRIKELVEENELRLHALCNDYIIEHTLPGNNDVLKQNLNLIERGRLLGTEKYILPLFDSSEMDPQNIGSYVGPLRDIADAAKDASMIVCLETILTGSELIDLLDQLNHSHIKVVYDTGNRVAFGHDLPGDIRLLGDRIAHVHIKDKDTNNQNVLLGTGLVNFADVFAAVNDIDYKGPYTFETQRGRDPLRTAAYNMMLVNFFREESGAR
ncbi:MAG: sugar phosphate isomerase/epimerase family protein [Rhodospirillales bacterium]|jgi:sugar phosphate isomerase/epimerase|nr:sugar phosphate isomerase/epimerase family protein [Rhodospirillales bacterium]